MAEPAPGVDAPVVRPAGPDDAATIAHVHVAAWRAAYRGGLLPDRDLDQLTPEQREPSWQRLLDTPPPGVTVLVAERATGLTGFVMVGPERDGEDPRRGELHALNVHPDAWGRGDGPALLDAGTRTLAGSFDTAVLWVHPGNARARRFYERAGWTDDDDARTVEVWGLEVPEVRYRRNLG
jgi:ribosomal protein S18 acetylase RimI-like enzyme